MSGYGQDIGGSIGISVGSSRAAEIIIAASDSSTRDKMFADYVCTGTNDDVIINAAIQILQNSPVVNGDLTGDPTGGGKVLLLAGTYNIGHPIVIKSNGITIQGMGWIATHIHLQNGANCDMIQYLDDGANDGNVGTLFGVYVRDLWLYGNAANQSSGHGIHVTSGYSGTVNTNGTAVTWVSGTTFNTLWAANTKIVINDVMYTIASVQSATSLTLNTSAGTQTGVSYAAGIPGDLHVDHVWVENCKQDGFHSDLTWGERITDSLFEYCLGNGGYIGGGSSVYGEAYLSGVHCGMNTGHGIEVAAFGITGNNIQCAFNGGDGLRVSVNRNSFSNVFSYQNTLNGVYVSAAFNQISNSQFVQNKQCGVKIDIGGNYAQLSNIISTLNNYASGTGLYEDYYINALYAQLNNCLGYGSSASPYVKYAFHILGNGSGATLTNCVARSYQANKDLAIDSLATGVAIYGFISGSGFGPCSSQKMFQFQQKMTGLAAASPTSVHAAITLTGSAQDITTGITNPDSYRVVSVTGASGGAGAVTITGTDWNGQTITNTITAVSGSTVNGVKPFKTVTKISVPAGSGTISVGCADIFGLYKPIAATSDMIEVARKASAATSYTIETTGAVDATNMTVAPGTATTANDSLSFTYYNLVA